MTFRTSTTEDVPQIMTIIRQAQNYLRKQKVDQWQDGYPNEESVKADIENGVSYVYEKEGRIIGTLALIFEKEPTYEVIYDGEWKTEDIPYATIHRIAVKDECKGNGIAGEMLAEAEQTCKTRNVHCIRIDTHEDNFSMQRWLGKNGFEYCGWITLMSGEKRLAFEKRISRNRKDMHRSTWHRCLKKEYVAAECEFRGKEAKISLSVLKELTGPLWVPDRGGKTLIADTDYSWLQLAVKDEYFYMTAMFDPEDKLRQMYFDLTNGTIFDNPDNPCFDDMYLDIVLTTDGYIAVLDEDELEEAYAGHIISRREYEKTLAEGEKLKDYLENNKEEMMEFCRDWYKKLREKQRETE